MSHEKLRPEFLFDEEKIEKLKQIAPECFEDGKINFETLKQNLGEWAQEEDGEVEHFGLFWPGKKDARRIAAIPPEGTLVPVYGEGLKADGTPDTDGLNDSKNIFIEGENLEVLKILQKSYAGKIKMIYIDPPYNTGNDFVYDDDFTEPLQEYLRRTGQVDEEGKALTTNKRSDGRFHSKWLDMIYPRLRLAKDLLADDGMIFISIDDNEIHNLRAVCNEVFGEENFMEQFIWKKSYGGGAKSKYSVNLHEYVLHYAKNKEAIGFIELPPSEDVLKYYKWEDEKKEIRGPFRKQPLATNSMDDRPNLKYGIPFEGEEIWPEKQWQWSKEKTFKALENNELVFTKKKNGWTVDYKQYLKDEDGKVRGSKPYSVLDGPYTQQGTKEITELFGNGKVFTFPKPSDLIKYFVSFLDEDSLVLDFFAGSCSTAQGVLNLNKENQKNHKFLLCQFPEQIEESSVAYETGYRVISEIGRDRIKKATKKFNYLDSGFKVFALSSSNFKRWSNYSGTSVFELEENLDLFNQEPLQEGWTKEGLLSEIILMEGFVLSSTIEPQRQYTKNEVNKVNDENCEHSLQVCLDEKIAPETIESLELSGNDIFICLDSAISNVDKLRLSDKGLIKTI
jgi:adenine-specific DNA-methyltransferase